MTEPDLSQQIYSCATCLPKLFTPFELYDAYNKKYHRHIAYNKLGYAAMDDFLETLPFLSRVPDATRSLFSVRNPKCDDENSANGLDCDDLPPEDLPTLADIEQILKEQDGKAISAKRLADAYQERFGIRLATKEKKRLSGGRKSFIDALASSCRDFISYRHSTVEFYQLPNATTGEGDDDPPPSTPMTPKKSASTKEKMAALLELKGVLLNLLEKKRGRASVEELKKMYTETNGTQLDPVALVGMEWSEFLKEIRKDPLKITSRKHSDGKVYLRNPNCAWFAYKKLRNAEKKQEAACDRILHVLTKNGGKATFEEVCDLYSAEYGVDLDPVERRNISGVGSKPKFCLFLKGHKEKFIVLLKEKTWILWTPEVYAKEEGDKKRKRSASCRSRRYSPSHPLETETEGEHVSNSSQNKKKRGRTRVQSACEMSSQETLPLITESSSSHVDSSTPDASQESLATPPQGILQNAFHDRVGGKKRRNTYQPPKAKVARKEEIQRAVVKKEEPPPIETVLDIIKSELGLGKPFTVDQLQLKYRAKTGSLICNDDYGFSSVADLLVAQRHIVSLHLPDGHFFSFIKNEEEYEDVTTVVQEMMESGELPGPQLFQQISAFGSEPTEINRWPEVLPHLSMQQMQLLMIKDLICEMLPLTGVPLSLSKIRRGFFCLTHLNLSPENLLLLSWDRFLCELRKDPLSIIAKFEEDSGWTLQIVQKEWPAGRERFRDALSRAITAKQDEGREVIHRLIENYGGQTTLSELERLYKEAYGIPLGREERYLLTGVAGFNKFVRVLAQRAKMFAISRSSTGVWHIATYEYALRQQIDSFGLDSSVNLAVDDSICELPQEDEDGYANLFYGHYSTEDDQMVVRTESSNNTSITTSVVTPNPEGLVEVTVASEGIVENAMETGDDAGISLQEQIPIEGPMDCGEDVTINAGKAQNPERPAANDTVPPSVIQCVLTEKEKTFVHVIKASPSAERGSTSAVAKPPTSPPTSSRDVKLPTASLMAQTSPASGVSKYAHFGDLFVDILDQADRNGENVDAIILRTLNALYGR